MDEIQKTHDLRAGLFQEHKSYSLSGLMFIYISCFLWLFTQVKSMTQHVSHLDKQSVPRRGRFSDRFKDDISTIVAVVTAEIGTILVKQHKVSNTGGRGVNCYLFAVRFSATCSLSTVSRVHPVHLGCASVLQQGVEGVNYGSSVMSTGSHRDGHPSGAATR